MSREFCLAWEKNKENLREYLKNTPQDKYADYHTLVALLFDKVINPELSNDWDTSKYDTDSILTIDDGDYQGTLIFILHRGYYQPYIDDYVYTSVCYGSCSGCDTLQGIICSGDWDDDKANEDQVNDYMSLCLHLLQNCRYMGCNEEEKEN